MNKSTCPVCDSDQYNTVYDSPVKTISFDNIYKAPIMNKEKTMTIRYNFTDDVGNGDIIAFSDEDDQDFAWAKIIGRAKMSCRSIVNSAFEGHANYGTMEQLALSLRNFYPESYFGEKTMLDIIWFDVVMEVNHASNRGDKK